jgi:hypothetical protein
MNQVLFDLADLAAQVAALGGGAQRNPQAVASLYDAWAFYGSLVRSVEFLPTVSGADATAAAAQVTAYLQDVASTALAGGTLAYAATPATLIDAFLRMYERQHDLVVFFSAPIQGIADTSRHRRFATLLNTSLEQDNAIGELSLRRSVETQNLTAAIAAQNRINSIVRDEGGDVTTGNLEVLYLGAAGATETLVIGSTVPVLYRFSVTNRTNRNLASIQLRAEFLPPRQTWTSLTIVDTSGGPVSSLALAPFDPTQPTDSRATREVRVAVTTPGGAANGDTGVLQLTASVPPPIDVRNAATRTVSVANTPTSQTPGIVSFAVGSPIISGPLTGVAVGVPVSLEFQFSFSALTGPSTRNFRFHVDISAPATPDTFFFVELAPAFAALDPGATTAIRKSSQTFTMTDGSVRAVAAAITPLPGASGQSMTFTARVESATDGVLVRSQPFTITVA